MPKSVLLFDLIHALSRSEKRYFKLFCSQSGTSANYIRLFEVIEEQEVYDEPAIKEKFAGEKFIKQLHATKYYLRNLILKSLRNYHARISRSAMLKDTLRNIEILFHKELYDLCESELKKAETVARDFELMAGMVEVRAWQRKLAQARSPHQYGAFLSIVEAQQQAIDCLYNLNQYWQLAVRVSQQITSRRDEPVENSKLLTDPANALTLEAKTLHYNTRYFQFLGRNDLERAEQTLFELVEYLEQHDYRIAEDAGMYASSVNNLISFLVFQKKYELAIEIVQRAKGLYNQWKILSEQKTLFKQIMRTYNIELEIYRDTRLFDEQAAFISSIEDFVREFRHKMPKSYLLSFWFQLANIHFMQRNFEHALSWINEILNARDKSLRTDLQIHARMMNLMIHLEQQNMFVLRYFVDSTRRFLKKQRAVAEHESILLKFFSSIAQAPVMEYRDRFRSLRERLFPKSGEPLVPKSLDYLDYKAWIDDYLEAKR